MLPGEANNSPAGGCAADEDANANTTNRAISVFKASLARQGDACHDVSSAFALSDRASCTNRM